MNRVNFGAMLIFSGLVSALAAQEAQKPPPHVPETVSEEAQEFLRSTAPVEFHPKTREDWETLQSTFVESFTPSSKAVLGEHAEKVEVKKFGGVDVHVITPKNLDAEKVDRILIYVHGGGYVLLTAGSTYAECAPLANLTGLRVYSIDYRLAPQHPFPAGLDDCVAAYRDIVTTTEADKVGVFGVSAGGSMILALMLRARDENLPMPRALATITPWADLTKTGDTYFTLDGIDPVLHSEMLLTMAKAYAGDADMKQPLLSPVYGKYSKCFPPTIIQTGTRDLFLSNCVRLYRKMKDSGVDVELSVWEGMWHGFLVIPNSEFPEAKAGVRELADFFAQHLQLKEGR